MGTLSVIASNLTVAIVDDHEAVRLGFAGMCENSDLRLVGEAATVPEIISKINGLEDTLSNLWLEFDRTRSI